MIKKRRPRFVSFAILTTITLLTWAVLDIWRTFQKPAPLEADQSLLKEFDPTLDRQTIKDLENTLFFTDEEAREIILERRQQSSSTSSGEEGTPPESQ